MTTPRRGEGPTLAGVVPGELLEEAVARWCGAEAPPIASTSRRPSRFATRSTAEELEVRLTDGSSLALFVKRTGPEMDGHPDKLPRDRELRIYRELLDGHELPVPVLLGAGGDGSGRLVLILEHVDALSLKYRELEHWPTAARRLGELHARLASRVDELERADFLLRLDYDYLAAWAQRARAAVARRAPSLGRRLGDTSRVLPSASALLDVPPRTLVHNDLAPKNVLADTASDPPRIAFVDWELAGVGCGTLDLAHLMHGVPPEEAQRMRSAYCAGWAEVRPSAQEPATDRVLDACALHNTIYRLAHIDAWGVADPTAEAWVGEVERLGDALGD